MRYPLLLLTMLALPADTLGDTVPVEEPDVTVSDWEAAFGFDKAEHLIEGLEAVVQSHYETNEYDDLGRKPGTPKATREAATESP